MCAGASPGRNIQNRKASMARSHFPHLVANTQHDSCSSISALNKLKCKHQG
uniref:Uncharacterized protein n=1 Tax=Anguilla anguilla TaxID=7936 RepID=A0A0E9RKH5_ANGAN